MNIAVARTKSPADQTRQAMNLSIEIAKKRHKGVKDLSIELGKFSKALKDLRRSGSFDTFEKISLAAGIFAIGKDIVDDLLPDIRTRLYKSVGGFCSEVHFTYKHAPKRLNFMPPDTSYFSKKQSLAYALCNLDDAQNPLLARQQIFNLRDKENYIIFYYEDEVDEIIYGLEDELSKRTVTQSFEMPKQLNWQAQDALENASIWQDYFEFVRSNMLYHRVTINPISAPLTTIAANMYLHVDAIRKNVRFLGIELCQILDKMVKVDPLRAPYKENLTRNLKVYCGPDPFIRFKPRKMKRIEDPNLYKLTQGLVYPPINKAKLGT